MNFLSDVITYIRRIVKTPSNAALSDNLIIDYINRFWLMDSDGIFQLFDLKTKYQFQTSPGINHYNMPLYNTNGYPNYLSNPQPGNQEISYYPVYQGFVQPAFVNGIQVPFYTDRASFYNIWPLYVQGLNNSYVGDGTTTTFALNLPFFPVLAGYVDITGIIAGNSNIDPIVASTLNTAVVKTSVYPAVFVTSQDANNSPIVVSDSGQFFTSLGTGPEAATGNMQLGMLTGDTTQVWEAATNTPSVAPAVNLVNYTTGLVNVTFARAPGNGTPINLQCYFFQQGIPRAILFNNNCLSIMPPPDISYLVELDAYLTPAAFLTTSASIPFAYMSEYIARGAARKILSDTGDVEQFMFYEPLFKEQRDLVWKRSQRQFTSQRTGTIFSEYSSQSPSNNYAGGGN
jgi:hypothetical protein